MPNTNTTVITIKSQQKCEKAKKKNALIQFRPMAMLRDRKREKKNKTLLHHVAKEGGGRCKTRSDTRLSSEGRQGYKNAGSELSDGPTNRQPDRRTRKRPLVARYL